MKSFFSFSFKVTVNRAQLGRRPMPVPAAKNENQCHIADARLLFDGRIRRLALGTTRTLRRG
jgi:hypothetical protein